MQALLQTETQAIERLLPGGVDAEQFIEFQQGTLIDPPVRRQAVAALEQPHPRLQVTVEHAARQWSRLPVQLGEQPPRREPLVVGSIDGR